MNTPHTARLALTEFVDVFDRQDLFELLDNERVLELSRLGGGGGFSGVSVLRRSTGIDCRRILRPGITPIDVAIAVAEQLRVEVGFDYKDVPAVLLCHSHVDSDRSEELAADLAEHLGIPASKVHGFNLGCGGFLKLIKEGARIATEAGPMKHVPLLSIEIPEQWHDAADKAFCGIVSAGAGATTIWQGPGHELLTFDAEEIHIPAEKRSHRDLFTKEFCEGFDFRGKPLTREVMHMDGESVFINGVELMLDGCKKAMDAVDDPSRRVVAVPHQPSGKLLKALIATAKLDLPDVRFVNNLPDFGNTLSSTIPVALSRLDDVTQCNEIEPVRSGDIVILTAAGICMPKRADHMMQGYATLAWQ